MLRNLGIREKVLAVLAVPMVLVLALTGVIVFSATSTATRASRIEKLATTTEKINAATHAVQDERAATFDLRVNPGDKVRTAVLTNSRVTSDTAVQAAAAAIKNAPYASVSPVLGKAAKDLLTQYAALPSVRKASDENSTLRDENFNDFDGSVNAALALSDFLIQAIRGDDSLSNSLRASTALSHTIEDYAKERDLTAVALLRQDLTQASFRDINNYLGAADTQRATFAALANKADIAALNDVISNADLYGIDGARGETVLQLSGNVSRTSPAVWTKSANTMILPVVPVESSTLVHAAGIAGDHAASQRNRALLVAGLAVLSFVGVFFLGLFLSRRMVEPLLDLTDAAEAVREELPRMVARMQKPGEGPGLEIDQIPVQSNDEIGRLAETFNAVNATVVQVAKEQAALRASIAEMFVNVARRNQVLLGRQLSFIDSMEKREEDPDVLENLFRLDHLATRMRRTSESLLVLAGIDASRRLRSPMPLSDVVRTAASEIEQFERVDLAATVDPLVTGRVALTLAHLVAELLENATNFSNPETRVIVSAALKPGLVELSITDYGLGLTEDEIDEANSRIANPPLAEIAVAQRLGHFVVGRLAERLGVKVVLRKGRSAGTVVFIELPAYVFQPGELPAAPEGTPEVAAPTRPELPVAQTDKKTSGKSTKAKSGATVTEAAQAAPVAEADESFAWPEDNFVRMEHLQEPVLKKGLLGRRRQEDKKAVPAEVSAAQAEPVEESAPVEPQLVTAGEAQAPLQAAAVVAEVEVAQTEAEVVEVTPVAPVAEPQPVEQPLTPVTAAAAVPVVTPSAAATLTELAVAPEPEVATAAAPKVAFATTQDILPGKPLSRSGDSGAVPAQRPAPAPAPEPAEHRGDRSDRSDSDQEPVRENVAAGAQIASAAFAELSTISAQSYAPKFAPGSVGTATPGQLKPAAAPVAGSGPAGLVRRQPKHEAPATPATPVATPAPITPRNAEAVRGMLSGFRAGVERGRTAPVNSVNGDNGTDAADASSTSDTKN